MGLVGAGMVLLGLVMSVGLIAAHAPGELVAVAYLVSGGIGALAMVRVIKHYDAVDERRKREEIILSR
jgi:hypothetical protein